MDTASAQSMPAPLDPTGVPGLDAVLGGGLPRGALTLVVGPPGSGKTTLAAQIAVATARVGHPALILTAFSEPVSKLIGHLRTLRFFDNPATLPLGHFGLSFEPAIERSFL